MHIVTGGAGFIGSALVRALEDRGHYDTVVCDVLGTDSKWKNLGKRELHSFILPQELFQFLNQNASRVDTLFHMGAISTTTETDADGIMSNNFRFSQSLWLWCAINKKRFIYASSAATYGAGDQGFVDEETPDFLAKLRPLNAYAWSKHLFDRWVARTKDKNAEAPTQCVGLKFFNVYGPNEYHKGGQRSVAVQIFETLKRGDPIRLFKSHRKEIKDGEQLRDFIYVQDCVDVMLWMLDHPEVNGLFNVGTGKARSFNDLATSVYKAVKGKTLDFKDESQIQYIPMPETLQVAYQDFTEAKMDKLKKAGYTKPFTSLERGVGEYVKDYLAKEDIYL